eukprot:CAMPEP_0116121988 /NCGR_PEP_ID=MMETSP0329-20121206/3981_1 /TAXON_ID=697910 /ORGANISM="Pseudo-nitzschia arenysensis, Strain B593" /LENGTH=456 /DNA_ID=CAMNT_0003615819 /DNA_START=27 /DNA_END=1397 /DNA_ORIENTATION=-
MLSGIRTGKSKKKKAKTNDRSRTENVTGADKQNRKEDNADSGTIGTNRKGASIKNDDNLSVAERLKQALASGMPLGSNKGTPKSYMERVIGEGAVLSKVEDNSNGVLVLDAPGTGPLYNKKREEDMTVAELAAKERVTGENSMSWNEHMTRDILRVGKKRKMKARGAGEDSDEEVERIKKHLPDYHLNNKGLENKNARKSAEQVEKEEQRNRRRQIDQYRKQEKITSMCSWWINSSSFAKDRLLAFGKHVSLMMAPPSSSLVPGHQFYLVPLKHAPSMVDCDDHEVREELKLFRNSLENLYARERKGIILCETVLPSNNFWQTKIEVIPVPFSQLQDAPIYFKSALVEQAEEFGTHTKLMKTSSDKPLRSVIPKKFPYFSIEWGNISSSSSTGYAQIIESSSFPRDFGLDTLASMIEVDPIRFHRKKKFPKGFEAELVGNFSAKWKAFDWTQRIED